MIIPHYLFVLFQWGVNVAFWPSLVFTPVVSVVWPWWRSFWGINIISLEIAIMLALVGSVMSIDFGLHVNTNFVLAWVIVAALWFVGIIVSWRCVLVIQEQLRGSKLQHQDGIADCQHSGKKNGSECRGAPPSAP